LTQPKYNRATDTLNLKRELLTFVEREKIMEIKEVKRAVEYALKIAHKEHLICVTGSLYTVSEASSYLKEYL
jgi:folylpolyglutamate synthase/dihydropteroate synthase